MTTTIDLLYFVTFYGFLDCVQLHTWCTGLFQILTSEYERLQIKRRITAALIRETRGNETVDLTAEYFLQQMTSLSWNVLKSRVGLGGRTNWNYSCVQ